MSQPRDLTLLFIAIGLAAACAADDASGDAESTAAMTVTGMTAATTTATSSSASGSGAASGSSGDPFAVDVDAVLAQAANYATDMVQVNDVSTRSEHALADRVNFFVAPEMADLYGMLDPAAPTLLEFPEGTLLVKENRDTDDSPDGYFLMYKATAGYDPDNADWFWARVDGAGNVPNQGKVGFCIDCHGRVAATGWAFGVPLDNRRP